MNKEQQDKKKILIFLFEKYNGDNNKIILEMMEKKEKADRESVNTFIKNGNFKLTDYVCFWERKFPKRYTGLINPILIIRKEDIKSVRDILTKKLVSENEFNGMQVREFMNEFELDSTTSLNELNKILIANNINPFN